MTDFIALAPSLEGDVVFLSPPWGGPDYKKEAIFDLGMVSMDDTKLFKLASQISPNIAYYLPRTVDKWQVGFSNGRYTALQAPLNETFIDSS